MRKAILALAVAFGGVAMAHTKIQGSSPADGSTVANVPKEFTLTFAEAVQLTTLTVQKDGGEARKITPLPKATAAQLKVPAPPLENGHYTVTWRVLGKDGHVMTGKIGFTVGSKPAPAGH